MAARIAAAIVIAALIIGSAVYLKPWAKQDNSVSLSKDEMKAAHEGMAKFNLKDAESKKPVSKESLDAYLKNIPEVIAEIGGEPLSNKEYVRAMTGVIKNMTQNGSQMPTETFEMMKKSLYEKIINTVALDRHAIKSGYSADEKEVEKALTNFKGQYPSEEVFKKEMAKYNSSEEQLRKEIERSYRVKALLDKEVINGIVVSEEKAKEFYEKNSQQFMQKQGVRASHILVSAMEKEGETKRAEARKKAEELLEKAKAGEDFAKLAKEFSDDKGTGARGGDLNFFSKGMMVPPFEEAAFKLKTGEISEIVETQFGFHIIKATDKREEGLQPFENVKESVMQRLKNVESTELINVYIGELKKKMNVKAFLS